MRINKQESTYEHQTKRQVLDLTWLGNALHLVSNGVCFGASQVSTVFAFRLSVFHSKLHSSFIPSDRDVQVTRLFTLTGAVHPGTTDAIGAISAGVF